MTEQELGAISPMWVIIGLALICYHSRSEIALRTQVIYQLSPLKATISRWGFPNLKASTCFQRITSIASLPLRKLKGPYKNNSLLLLAAYALLTLPFCNSEVFSFSQLRLTISQLIPRNINIFTISFNIFTITAPSSTTTLSSRNLLPYLCCRNQVY